MTEKWYRYEDRVFAAPIDESGRACGHSTVRVHLRALPVLRRTKRGVWLDDYGTPHFVLADARKRYACPTIEEAKESFLARKNRQASILRARVRQADDAIACGAQL